MAFATTRALSFYGPGRRGTRTLDRRTGRTYTPRTTIEDWNREFSDLVRRGVGEPDDLAPASSERAVENDPPISDASPDRAISERRLSIAARLVVLGFIASDRATPANPAVEVLSELLPPDAELDLCLTCHGVSSSASYPFARTTGIFPNVASFRMNPAGAHLPGDGTQLLLAARRRELVVCSQVALSWTSSRVRSDQEDIVTLYSLPFRDILGATVRQLHKRVVDVWVQDGPTLSFRVTPAAADAFQAYVDATAQSQ